MNYILALIITTIFLSASALSAAPAVVQPKNVKKIKVDISAYIDIINNLIKERNYYKGLGYVNALLNNIADLDQYNLYYLTYTAGELYTKIGRYDTAIKYYEKGIAIDNKSYEAYVALQELSLIKKDYKGSLKHYSDILKLNNDNIPIKSHYLAAVANYSFANYAKTVQIAEKIKPGSVSEFIPYILYTKALALINMNEKKLTSDAISILKKISESSEYPAKLREKAKLTNGRVKFEEGSYKDSLLDFEHIVNKGSFFIEDALYGIIWDYIKLKDYDNAFKTIDKLLSKYKNGGHYIDVIILKGQLYKKLKKFQESVDSFEMAKNELASTIKLSESYRADPNELSMLVSLYEVADFPVLRYYPDFKYITFLEAKGKRYNEDRMIKEIINYPDLYEDMLILISLRKTIDGFDYGKIGFQYAINSYEYNLTHYQNTAEGYREEIDKLKDISLANIKNKIYSESSIDDIKIFAAKKEKIILKEADERLNSAVDFFQYVNYISVLLNTTFPEKDDLFKKLQDRMLSAPTITKDSEKIEKRIITRLEDIGVHNVVLNFNDKQLLSLIQKEVNKLHIINDKLAALLWDVVGVMYKDNNGKGIYWNDTHEKVKFGVSELTKLADSIRGSLFILKNNAEDSIRKNVESERIQLKKLYANIEIEMVQSETKCLLLIDYINSIVEELSPLKEIIAKTKDDLSVIENENIALLQKAKDNFREKILKKFDEKIDNYNLLMEEINYELADSLFYINAGESK